MKKFFSYLMSPGRSKNRPTRLGIAGLLTVLALLGTLLPAATVFAHPTFADTKFNPSSQSTTVGSPTSVNLVFVVPGGGAYGIDAIVHFDPTKLQVTSLTGSGVWTTDSGVTGYDNTAGTFRYKATGSNVNNQTITVATIVFNPIAAGTSPLQFLSVNQYIPGYGPYGVNGLAVNGAITVAGTIQTVTFLGGVTDALHPVGSLDTTTEWYDTQSGTWKPAYLVGPHPWGEASGTNSWLNMGPSFYYGLNAAVDYRVRFVLPADYTNASGTLNILADNVGTFVLNGTSLGTYVNARGIFPLNTSVLVPGINELRIRVVDHGGLAGFNYRADFSVVSESPIIVIPPDATSPIITHVISGTMGNNGWYTSNVGVTFSAADAESAITATSPAGNPYTYNLTSNTAGTAVTYSATSAGGMANDSVTVKIDKTAPNINGTVTSGTLGSGGWYKSDVVVTFTASDDMSGLASVTAPVTVSTEGANQKVTGKATDNAGNESFFDVFVSIDKTAPTLTITGPTTVTLGAAASATVAAFDSLSGLAVDPSGAVALDTSTVGARSFSRTATDNAGNSKTVTFSYSAIYGFKGLLDPYSPTKAHKINSSIPLKWQYTNALGTVINSASAAPYVKITNSSGGIVVNDSGKSGLQYDALTNTWQWNWQTKGLTPGVYNVSIVCGQTGQENGTFPITLR